MDFIEKMQADILEVTQNSKLKPSVVMAQAIVESNWGKSELASVYNNYFGIKATDSWDGKTVTFPTEEYTGGSFSTIVDQFRVYPSRYASISNHHKFLKTNPRYSKVFEADTAKKQANELQKAAYATDPNYSDKLKNIISKYDLKYLDRKEKSMKKINIIFAVLSLAASVIYVIKIYKQTSKK